MACYAQIDVALADEGGYVARWEEDAVVSCKFFLSKYIVCLDWRWVGEMGNRERARWLVDGREWKDRDRAGVECGDVQCDGVVL